MRPTDSLPDAQYRAMRMDDSALFERFVDARRYAVELTDHYYAAAAEGDQQRAELWEQVVEQTEEARLLLESWLETSSQQSAVSRQELVLSH